MDYTEIFHDNYFKIYVYINYTLAIVTLNNVYNEMFDKKIKCIYFIHMLNSVQIQKTFII